MLHYFLTRMKNLKNVKDPYCYSFGGYMGVVQIIEEEKKSLNRLKCCTGIKVYEIPLGLRSILPYLLNHEKRWIKFIRKGAVTFKKVETSPVAEAETDRLFVRPDHLIVVEDDSLIELIDRDLPFHWYIGDEDGKKIAEELEG